LLFKWPLRGLLGGAPGGVIPTSMSCTRKTIFGLPEPAPLAHDPRLAIVLWLPRSSPCTESPVRVGRFFDMEQLPRGFLSPIVAAPRTGNCRKRSSSRLARSVLYEP